eukprot:363866-Chlamydomonas_euryale.AAC.2
MAYMWLVAYAWRGIHVAGGIRMAWHTHDVAYMWLVDMDTTAATHFLIRRATHLNFWAAPRCLCDPHSKNTVSPLKGCTIGAPLCRDTRWSCLPPTGCEGRSAQPQATPCQTCQPCQRRGGAQGFPSLRICASLCHADKAGH